jgi:hypothetical protein
LNKPTSDDRTPWQALDPAVSAALRPGVPELAKRVIKAVQEAVPAYEGELDANVRRGVRQALEGFIELVEGGDEALLPGRQVYVSFGRAEARRGRSVEVLLAAYRAGAQAAWRGFAEAGDRAGLAPRDLYTLAEALFAYIDQLSAASAEGVAQEQTAAAREAHERRRRLLELLLYEPRPDPALLQQAVEAAGWAPPKRLAALAVDAPDPDRIAHRITGPVLSARLDGLSWALVADPDGPGRRAELEAAAAGRPAALGPTVAWREAGESARRARLALALASEAPGALVVAEERLLDLLLLCEPALTVELARQALSPLDGLPAAKRRRLRATLEAWLDCHGQARAAAERLHVHVQTLRYRLGQLEDLFGEALEDPRRRIELQLALRAPSSP